MNVQDRTTRDAAQLIDKMYGDGKTVTEIMLTVQATYGKGTLFVKRRVELLEKLHQDSVLSN